MNVLAGEMDRAILVSCDSVPRDWERQLPECSRLAFRVAWSVLRQREDAEDVAQEALLRAFRHRGRIRDAGRLPAWIVRTAWRLALDHRRAAGRRRKRETAAAGCTRDFVAADATDALFASALDSLPPRLRQVMVLAAIAGYDTCEMARLLHLPEGTVKSRLFAARKKLAARFS